MQETHETHVIRERIAGPPSLLPGEQIEFEATHGFAPTLIGLCIVGTLIPPFIWGLLLLFGGWHQKKHNRTWVTDRRVVYFTKPLLSRQYLVISVPLAKVREARRLPRGCLSLLDQLLGVADVHVFVDDSRFAQCSISDVKSPEVLIQEIEKRAGSASRNE